MQPRLAVIVVGLATAFIVFVLVSVRRERLTEPLAVFWIALFSGIGAFSLLASRELIDRVAHVVGVVYAPGFYLLVGILVVFGVLLYFSIQLSLLSRTVRALAQEVALLARHADDAAPGASPGSLGSREDP